MLPTLAGGVVLRRQRHVVLLSTADGVAADAWRRCCQRRASLLPTVAGDATTPDGGAVNGTEGGVAVSGAVSGGQLCCNGTRAMLLMVGGDAPSGHRRSSGDIFLRRRLLWWRAGLIEAMLPCCKEKMVREDRGRMAPAACLFRERLFSGQVDTCRGGRSARPKLTKANTVGGDKEWYFFCLRGRKYRNSVRPNRVTGAGFWKATGIDRPINARGRCIGLKKSLVYYHRGSAGKGTKTEWMMHEFRLPPRPTVAPAHSSPCLQEAEVWTICRIFKRTIAYKRHPQQQVAGRVAASVVPQPESSSVTACSLESVCTGEIDYEYMNCLQTPNQAPAAANNMTNGYNGQNFQGLQHWDSTAVHPVTAQPLPAMASLSVPSSPAENDDYWDDIGRMVLELTDPDPSVFYDCRY